jgi:hypothetical protein
MPSRVDDVPQQVGFVDVRWFMIAGAGAVAEVGDETIYLAVSLRNMGSGIAVLHGWCLYSDPRLGSVEAAPLEDFHRLTRDLYIASNEAGFWQGALRDPAAPEFETAGAAIVARQRLGIQILYGDHEGGQRTISMFAFTPREDGTWAASVSPHWSIDRPDSR